MGKGKRGLASHLPGISASVREENGKGHGRSATLLKGKRERASFHRLWGETEKGTGLILRPEPFNKLPDPPTL